MTETDWLFGTNEVLQDNEGRWWHVLHRRVCVDCNSREYELADATHTEYKTLHAGDVEGLASEEPMFDSCGWATSTKPAVERGYRVNGVLCGPADVDHWKGSECHHEYACPDCGADGPGQVDIIVDHAEDRAAGQCRECGTEWGLDSNA